MTQYPKLYLEELKAQCRKKGLNPHQSREALKESLRKYENDFPVTQSSTLNRITMDVASRTDYSNHFCYELEDECDARGITIGHKEYKEDLVDKLLENDQALLERKSRALNSSNDEDGTRRRAIDEELIAFSYLKNEVLIRARLEDYEFDLWAQCETTRTKLSEKLPK